MIAVAAKGGQAQEEMRRYICSLKTPNSNRKPLSAFTLWLTSTRSPVLLHTLEFITENVFVTGQFGSTSITILPKGFDQYTRLPAAAARAQTSLWCPDPDKRTCAQKSSDPLLGIGNSDSGYLGGIGHETPKRHL